MLAWVSTVCAFSKRIQKAVGRYRIGRNMRRTWELRPRIADKWSVRSLTPQPGHSLFLFLVRRMSERKRLRGKVFCQFVKMSELLSTVTLRACLWRCRYGKSYSGLHNVFMCYEISANRQMVPKHHVFFIRRNVHSGTSEKCCTGKQNIFSPCFPAGSTENNTQRFLAIDQN